MYAVCVEFSASPKCFRTSLNAGSIMSMPRAVNTIVLADNAINSPGFRELLGLIADEVETGGIGVVPCMVVCIWLFKANVCIYITGGVNKTL